METCLALGRLAKVVARLRWCMLSFWLVVAAAAAVGATQFLSITSLSFSAPKGTASYSAEEYIKSVFPSILVVTDFVAILEVDPPRQILDVPGIRNFSFALRDSLNSSGKLTAFTSNATLWFGDNVSVGPGLVADGGSATIVQWTIAARVTSKESMDFDKEAQKKFQDSVDRWLPELSFSGITSTPTLTNVGIEDSESSLAKMDMIAMPIAFIVLWTVVRSGRLLLLTMACMGVALAVSFGVMYCVGLVIVVQTTTPSLMMSLLIAMSIDYSLFMLTRFREELELASAGQDVAAAVQSAVEKTMSSAGCMILLSGITLALAFLVLIFFPLDMFSSMGVGCSVSLVIALIVHLTLLPALLTAFPGFFGRCVSADRCGKRCFGRCCPRKAREGTAGPDCTDVRPSNGSALSNGQSVGAEPHCSGDGALLPREPALPVGKTRRPFWEWLARITTTFPYNLIIVVLVAVGTGAIGVAILHTKVTDDFLMALPRGTHTYDAFEHLIATFGIGAINPYRLLLQPAGPLRPGSVLTQEFWESSQQILEEMASRLPMTTSSDFQFLSYAGGQAVPWALVDACLQHTAPPALAFACKEVAYAIDKFSNADRSAAYALIALKFDPCGNNGRPWLDQARSLIDELTQSSGVRLELTGVGAASLDMISQSYAIFPYMVATTLAVAVVLLGVAFRSLVIPLRCVGSIVLTLFWVYGLAALTFQDGMLDWTGIIGVSSKFHAQSWFLPVICFSMVVGICLDYDIFLTTRTMEFRQAGATPVEAIRQGVCSTGGIITAAGIIMAIAFAGLMFASIVMVNGLSFYMVFAVLYDTFIARCLFTPAAMSLLGRFNWFPSPLCKRDWGRSLPG